MRVATFVALLVLLVLIVARPFAQEQFIDVNATTFGRARAALPGLLV